MAKQINGSIKLACACATALLWLAACGDDDSGNNTGTGGDGMQPFAGSGAVGTGGTTTPGSGGSSSSMTGKAGSGGSTTSNGGTGATPGNGTGGAHASADGGTTCAAASCAGVCCGDVCITNIDSNPNHCGICDKMCNSNETCTKGVCISMPRHCDVAEDDAGTSVGSNGCLTNEKCESIDGAPGECRCGDNVGCDPNETCSKAGKCMCGDGAGCAIGSGCCGGSCVDTQTDEDNCGECGHVCATGATCTSGVCECDNAGDIDCDGKCVASDSNKNCGKCGNACESPTTCRDPSGSRPLDCYCPNVNDVPCNGACVSLGTVNNCGSCGDACTGAANTCRNGSCQCPTAGQTACGDTCVDLRNGVDTDPGTGAGQILMANCGKCGVTCLAGAACNNGVCACPNLPSTDEYCDEDPVTGATDGNYMCIGVTTTKNCGGCGVQCLDDSECHENNPGTSPSDYVCRCIGSDAGKTHCADIGCRNLNNDETSCGECGKQCPDGITCVAGRCNCAGGNSVESCPVNGVPMCVDTSTDKKNCGGCGVVCSSSETCCGGNCVNPDTAFTRDNNNCGTCGHACPNSGCGLFGLFNCSCSNGTCN